jgi:hypothetical protein
MPTIRTEAIIENLFDRMAANRDSSLIHSVRRVVLPDAEIDLEGTVLSMPSRLIRTLGLSDQGCKPYLHKRGAKGGMRVFGVARLAIDGRDCPTEVLETADDQPVTIGAILLHRLDLVADAPNGKLIGNPAHGGEQMFEMY